MLNKGDIPRLLKSGLKREFFKGYDEVPTIYQDFVMEVNSMKNKEEYAWLGQTPKMREWVGERAPSSLEEFGFEVKNKDYESSIEVDRNSMDDDQYGQILLRVRSMGDEAKRSYDELFAETVESGETATCYDGQFFYDTDHVSGDSGTQSNKFYSGNTYKLGADSAKTIIQNMGDLKGDKAKKVAVNPTHILVPTGLEFVAKELFDPTYVGVSQDPSKASLKGRVKVKVGHYLSNHATDVSKSKYYFCDLTRSIKPFLFQQRKKANFVALDNENAETVFFKKKVYYGVDARHAMSYGEWMYSAMGGDAS